MELSKLQKERLSYAPQVPEMLKEITRLDFTQGEGVRLAPEVRTQFPHLSQAKTVTCSTRSSDFEPLVVGVVLSGGQAPGGHNVISGLFDALHACNPKCRLIGFLNGPSGIVSNSFIEITAEYLASYRNQGGFDIIGSGRTKIESSEQFERARNTCEQHALDGLVIIGGDDSNTNAAFLAEYFLEHSCKTCVVGVPKTIDGDLQSEEIEISFGFDSACKTYSEIVGNIMRDAISAKKYYYFIKLMGRSASHITLECALQCQPNMAIIGEEVEAQSLDSVVRDICTMIEERRKLGKEYGVILIPEGIIEFLPDMKALITEINRQGKGAVLQGAVKTTFDMLPKEFQEQLMLDRDPHGNVQVSKIETERLFISLVTKALSKKISTQPIFCGYEGRSCLPSNFDANYCYSLGMLAALTVARRHTGYIVSFTNLSDDVSSWKPAVSPLVSMLHEEEREGKKKLVIEKTLVDLTGKAFLRFKELRNVWRLDDCYRQIGPIQFYGPKEISDTIPLTLQAGK